MIHRFLKFLKKQRIIRYDPLEDIPMPKGTFKIGSILTAAQIELLEKNITEPYLSIFRLFLYLGMRAGSLLKNKSEKWQPIIYDEINNKIQIYMSKVNRFLYMPIPCNHGIREIIVSHLDNDYRVVFGITALEFYTELKRVSNRLGFHCTAHTLRRTFGTMITSQTGNIATTAGLLGHTDIKMTFKYYSHVLDRDKLQALDNLHY